MKYFYAIMDKNGDFIQATKEDSKEIKISFTNDINSSRLYTSEEAEDFITKLDSTKWESENFFSIMARKMTDEEYNGKGK